MVSRQVHHSVRNQLAVPRKLTTPLCAKVMNFLNISFLPFLLLGLTREKRFSAPWSFFWVLSSLVKPQLWGEEGVSAELFLRAGANI